MKKVTTPFWQRKTLEQLSKQEWESLCDGCGRCCLHKLEDIDTGAIAFTNVACRYLDPDTCRCTDYAQRTRSVPDCLVLRPEDIHQLPWLPATCAYRLLAEGNDLPAWHPLRSGDPSSVHSAGISVRGQVICETRVDDLEDHVVDVSDTPQGGKP